MILRKGLSTVKRKETSVRTTSAPANQDLRGEYNNLSNLLCRRNLSDIERDRLDYLERRLRG